MGHESLASELRAIDQRAFLLADHCRAKPEIRESLASEALLLGTRLKEISQQLAEQNPIACQAVSSTISEAILDLRYVQQPGAVMSLRLARRHRAGRMKG